MEKHKFLEKNITTIEIYMLSSWAEIFYYCLYWQSYWNGWWFSSVMSVCLEYVRKGLILSIPIKLSNNIWINSYSVLLFAVFPAIIPMKECEILIWLTIILELNISYCKYLIYDFMYICVIRYIIFQISIPFQ